jgi:hypothetical protein
MQLLRLVPPCGLSTAPLPYCFSRGCPAATPEGRSKVCGVTFEAEAEAAAEEEAAAAPAGSSRALRAISAARKASRSAAMRCARRSLPLDAPALPGMAAACATDAPWPSSPAAQGLVGHRFSSRHVILHSNARRFN